MGKSIGWTVGKTHYDGRLATDWERLEKLEAMAKENDESENRIMLLKPA